VILAGSVEYDDRPGPMREALVAGQRELRGALAKAVRLAIEEGHLLPDTDPWQVVFELMGIVLAVHHDRGLLDDPRADAPELRAPRRRSRAGAAPGVSHDGRASCDPAQYAESWPLLHAHSLTIRALQPEHADLEVRFGLALSQQSRYERFLGGGVKLTPELLARLVNVDFSRDAADRDRRVRRQRDAGRRGTLCPYRQGRRRGDRGDDRGCVAGLRTRPAAARARGRCGRRNGVRRLTGDVLATNARMLALAAAVRVSHRAPPGRRRRSAHRKDLTTTGRVRRTPAVPATEA
jgi:hypothetical protein